MYDEPTASPMPATIRAERAGAYAEPDHPVRPVEQAMDALSGEVARIDRNALELASRLRGLMPELMPEADDVKSWPRHGVPHADAISGAALNLSNASDRLEQLLRHLAL
ncbi:MAG: hypothetical protein SHS37scaffold145_89 [Phage 71_18]|nr:MAG: hypothetical protein SHS37scaffold145_89 [Phage 71_18]